VKLTFTEVEPTSWVRQQMPYQINVLFQSQMRTAAMMSDFCTKKFGPGMPLIGPQTDLRGYAWAKAGQLFCFRNKSDALLVMMALQGD